MRVTGSGKGRIDADPAGQAMTGIAALG